jgi:hypothetical protein
MKHILSLDNEITKRIFFEDTQLFGIISSLKAYQFCWHINSALAANFRLNPSLEIQLKKKGRNYYFPVYQYGITQKNITHYIYQNHNDGEALLPELKHIDFIWLLQGSKESRNNFLPCIQILKSIENVRLVVELNQEKIEHKEHLIF